MDARPADQDRQRLGAQALAAAGVAHVLGHERLKPLAHLAGGGFAVPAFQVRDNARKLAVVLDPAAAVGLLIHEVDAFRAAVEDLVHDVVGDRLKRLVQTEVELFRQGFKARSVPPRAGIVRANAVLVEGEAPVRHDEVRVELLGYAEAGTRLAGAKGAVERK